MRVFLTICTGIILMCGCSSTSSFESDDDMYSSDDSFISESSLDDIDLAEEEGIRYYTIQKGDTLSHISKRYYGTSTRWREILRANPHIKDEYHLKVGDRIRIP